MVVGLGKNIFNFFKYYSNLHTTYFGFIVTFDEAVAPLLVTASIGGFTVFLGIYMCMHVDISTAVCRVILHT